LVLVFSFSFETVLSERALKPHLAGSRGRAARSHKNLLHCPLSLCKMIVRGLECVAATPHWIGQRFAGYAGFPETDPFTGISPEAARFPRTHKTKRVTPSDGSRISDHVWELRGLLEFIPGAIGARTPLAMNDLPFRGWRPNKCLSRPRVFNQRLAWLAIFCLIGNCSATTVVTLVSTHGIVICSDGKSTDTTNERKPGIPVSHTSTKVFVIQNRFVLSHGGIRDFDIRKNEGNKRVPIAFPYSVDRMVGDLRREISPMLTLVGIANTITVAHK
jgi:hypothetical protein